MFRGPTDSSRGCAGARTSNRTVILLVTRSSESIGTPRDRRGTARAASALDQLISIDVPELSPRAYLASISGSGMNLDIELEVTAAVAV